MKEIIKRLEQQKAAIDRALAALKAVDGSFDAGSGGGSSVSPAPAAPTRKAKRKGGMTPEGRRRLSEALKARWAAKRTPESVAPTRKATKRGRKK